MEYYLQHKRIPVILPDDLLQDVPPPDILKPAEERCLYCKSDLTFKEDVTAIVFGFREMWHSKDTVIISLIAIL